MPIITMMMIRTLLIIIINNIQRNYEDDNNIQMENKNGRWDDLTKLDGLMESGRQAHQHANVASNSRAPHAGMPKR